LSVSRVLRKIFFALSRTPFIPGIGVVGGLSRTRRSDDATTRAPVDYFFAAKKMPLFKAFSELIFHRGVSACPLKIIRPD